jgi:DNA (cytosine-5)-methyltransferase 1
MGQRYRGVSLFSGAGGMDVGFEMAGVDVIWANECDKDACDTYDANHPGIVHRGYIQDFMDELETLKGVDIIFGGPPCQGFSVAGKMDPTDERSTLIWSFLNAVKRVNPRVFVCENVKALGSLAKWKYVRQEFLLRADKLGYKCSYVVLNSKDYGVPQNRERVFFIGARGKNIDREMLIKFFAAKTQPPRTVREVIKGLGPAGSHSNSEVCNAKITIATKPVLRRSPYAGMLFNGLGRPLELDGYSATLPASMGGNKTPIIDEELLHGNANNDWVREYHKHLWAGGEPLPFSGAPTRLRRITVHEAALIQTFPEDYIFCGSKSSKYRQIGNAVPCNLAKAVAEVALEVISGKHRMRCKNEERHQGMLDLR